MPPSGFSTRDAASLLSLSPSQVRAWVRAGFLAPRRDPRGAYRFSFQDLVLLRAAKELAAARVPRRRVRLALKKLREQLPRGRALSSVRVVAEGTRIVVRDGAEAWDPVSGQTVFDFQVAELVRGAAPLARRAEAAAARAAGDAEADRWYADACDLEASSLDEAKAAYRRALELDPDHADAHLNLGRLLHEERRIRDAERHYRAALSARPGDVTAAFNLGVALEDLRRPREAAAAYEAALAADPGYADAHYNLAGIYERLGESAAALRHLKAFRSLIRGKR